MDDEVERVGNLPEALIHHVLSFLDMKFVVQTSILSRRWRYVWTTVSTLVFSVNEFASPGTVLHSVQMNKFTRFIDKVLLLRGISDIKKFHLHWVDNLFDTYTVRELLKDHLNTWILVSLSRNVQELLIQIDTAANYHYLEIRFPHCLFNSQSLRKLVLDLTGEVESCVLLPKLMDLPSLKYLSLSSFYIQDVNSINKLISSCPVLESLVLREVWIENSDDMSISIESHELKHLEIVSESELREPEYQTAKTIRLSTPKLISFVCSAYVVQEYCLENLSSLVTATIQMTLEGSLHLEGVDLELSVKEKNKAYPKRMREFLRGLHNVKELTVPSPDLVQIE
ncbi:F-box/LRR-repeat protein At3g59200-like isoform X2 [Papaver somniferum]|uniref:F-box/LRR-repeat protein At3g59200-like isoform X2 n=1 Tax=Papaver somniferum TaxID=3469 RepID=UPI000E6FFA41|nr:F-box/LRR-repeat protein At3g59200-like isoform X2 [Papaver somniferum]